jgi:mono/diheme cytochrome c family protein
MNRHLGALFGVLACSSLAASGLLAAPQAPARPAGPARVSVIGPELADRAPAAPSRDFVDKYCAGCHNARQKSGNLVLDKREMGQVAADAAVWEKVIRKLKAKAMPPASVARRPSEAEVSGFVTSVQNTLDDAAARNPNPGRSGIHRLNRVEYANAIRDLLALEIDGRQLLPPDDSSFGFDNIADALNMSPGLMERYLGAAQKISRLVVADPAMKPAASVYKMSYFELQADRMGENLPFGSRGGLAVDHYFPVDGEYTVQVKLQRHAANLGGAIRGLEEVNRIDVLVDGARVRSFDIGGGAAEQDGATRGPYTETEMERFADAPMNSIRIPVRAGTHTVAVTFQRKLWLIDGVGVSRLPVASYGYASARISGVEFGKVEMAIDQIEIRGPFNAVATEHTPSRDKVFVCRPTPATESACASQILVGLARRAFRRPVAAADIQPLLALFKEGRQTGTFETGMQWAIERLLVDPRFLFRTEQDPAGGKPGTPYRLSDLELASRLSFFLWSTVPDDELLDVAAKGRLTTPAVFESQVTRMLKDKKADALIAGFFDQWLTLRNVRNAKPNTTAFPEFDEALRRAFRQETELFLASQVREDRSVPELLTANYTFVNDRLAQHYGIPNIYGTHFRRVSYPDDRRAGLLGHGSILLATSYNDRTSPVQRGKWLLMNILGTPPPDPPANVPPFPDNKAGEAPKSVRARLEQHRANPVCASCHSMMDPLGFALENFNGVGGWRAMDGATVIDPSGTMAGGGTKFNGPAEFRGILASRREQFVSTVTDKLLTYALGRGVEPFDQPVVRQIMREAEKSNYRWSALVLAITRSMPFQMRRSL